MSNTDTDHSSPHTWQPAATAPRLARLLGASALALATLVVVLALPPGNHRLRQAPSPAVGRSLTTRADPVAAATDTIEVLLSDGRQDGTIAPAARRALSDHLAKVKRATSGDGLDAARDHMDALRRAIAHFAATGAIPPAQSESLATAVETLAAAIRQEEPTSSTLPGLPLPGAGTGGGGEPTTTTTTPAVPTPTTTPTTTTTTLPAPPPTTGPETPVPTSP